MSSFTFTDQQKAAIIFNKSSIITACPGSGKTAVIQQKIISTTKNSPNYQGVIAITFTKKASEELKKRCTKNGNDTKLSFFGTIDSFCLTEIILPFLSRIWGGRPEDCKIVKKLSSDQMNYFKTDYKTPTYEDLRLDNGFKKLYENGILWMSSFAALSVLILNESSSVRQYIKTRYTDVFIDEYQDSSRSQHELFMKLFELGLIATAVGDTDQSIYQFRGSDPKYLTKLINDENFCHFELSVNHRCHPSIINYASRLINPKNELTLEKDIRVFRVTFKGDLRSAASQITNLIKELLIDKKIKNLSDIAVLGKKEKSLEEFSLNLGIEI